MIRNEIVYAVPGVQKERAVLNASMIEKYEANDEIYLSCN